MAREDFKQIVKEIQWYRSVDGELIPHELTDDEYTVICALTDCDKDEPTLDDVYMELLKSADRKWSREETEFMVHRVNELITAPISVCKSDMDKIEAIAGTKVETPTRNLILRLLDYEITDGDEKKPYRPTAKEFEFMEKVMEVDIAKGLSGVYPTVADMCVALPNWTREEVVETQEKMYRIDATKESYKKVLGRFYK